MPSASSALLVVALRRTGAVNGLLTVRTLVEWRASGDPYDVVVSARIATNPIFTVASPLREVTLYGLLGSEQAPPFGFTATVPKLLAVEPLPLTSTIETLQPGVTLS